ncbi:MAG: hypothetical protein ACP5QR_08220 [Rhizomicrobium sp.]
MASPSELVQALTDATGIPHATVVDIDRKLVASGLRTKGGRGLNAARMSTFDAARLLTAIIAAPRPTSQQLPSSGIPLPTLIRGDRATVSSPAQASRTSPHFRRVTVLLMHSLR